MKKWNRLNCSCNPVIRIFTSSDQEYKSVDKRHHLSSSFLNNYGNVSKAVYNCRVRDIIYLCPLSQGVIFLFIQGTRETRKRQSDATYPGRFCIVCFAILPLKSPLALACFSPRFVSWLDGNEARSVCLENSTSEKGRHYRAQPCFAMLIQR